MFTPTTSDQERFEKCTMGLTAMLTMAFLLLLIADMVPKAEISSYPFLGSSNDGEQRCF
jgi:hypothetical protein